MMRLSWCGVGGDERIHQVNVVATAVQRVFADFRYFHKFCDIIKTKIRSLE